METINMKTLTITLNTILTFGKYKGELVSDILPKDITSDVEAKEFIHYVKYFMWVKKNTHYILESDVIDRIDLILKQQPKKFEVQYRANKSRGRGLNHYNDMGAMNDISFQECFGDFGF